MCGGQIVIFTELRALGAEISAASCVIDCLQGGAEALAGKGIELLSLLTASDPRSATQANSEDAGPNPV
jgi:orotate phosphoribosyltransferase